MIPGWSLTIVQPHRAALVMEPMQGYWKRSYIWQHWHRNWEGKSFLLCDIAIAKDAQEYSNTGSLSLYTPFTSLSPFRSLWGMQCSLAA